jgi:hypothetical protein
VAWKLLGLGASRSLRREETMKIRTQVRAGGILLPDDQHGPHS